MTSDKLFKLLIRFPSLFRAMIEWVLPNLAPLIDFGYIEFIDKERISLDGKKREGDVLVKTRFVGQEETTFLFHLENQGQVRKDLPDRMLEYLALDRRECGMDVYPIVLVTCHWPDVERLTPVISDFPNKRVLLFDYDIVVLEKMLAWDHVQATNPAALALTGGMKVEEGRKAELAVSFLGSLAGITLSADESDVVAAFFFGHLRLTSEQELQMQDRLDTLEPAQKAKIMTLTNPFIEFGIEKGIEQGIQKGIQQGRLQGIEQGRIEGESGLVLRQLRRRFGALDPKHEAMVKKLPVEGLEDLGDALLSFQNVEDLSTWLAGIAR